MTAAERTRLIVDSQDGRLQRMEGHELYEEQLLNITRSEFVKICQVALRPPISPLYLPYISPISLPYICQVALRDKNDEDIHAAAASFVAANDLRTKTVAQP